MLLSFYFIHKMSAVIKAYEVENIKFSKPFRIIIGGGSGCGKTIFVKDLIDDKEFYSSFKRIVYNYPDYLDETYVEFNNSIEFIPGMMNQEFTSSLEPNSLIIIDDLAREVSKSVDLLNLFTVEARKRNISILLITQSLYIDTDIFRQIKLNCTGFVLFKFRAGIEKNMRILRDMGMSHLMSNKLFQKIYKPRYKYIYVDLHPDSQSEFCSIRSNILSEYPEVYYKMKYIAIKESDFHKYFKVIDNKSGEITAVKNGSKKKKITKKRKVEEIKSESETETETESD